MSTILVQTRAHRIRLQTAVFLLIIVIFAPLGNVFLSKGMKTIGLPAVWHPSTAFHFIEQILGSPYVWLGIFSLLVFLVAHMLALNWADFSYVQPSSSGSYLSLLVFSYLILGEHVSPLRFLGIVIICSGVLVVGRTHPRTTEPTSHA